MSEIKEGYLIAFLPNIPTEGQNEYVIKKGTSLHIGLELHQPEHFVIVNVSCHFALSEDDFHELKASIMGEVKKVLSDKGVNNVSVSVLLVVSEETSVSKNIQLNARVPLSIEDTVCNQEIISALSHYLSDLGYNVAPDHTVILISSEEKVSLTSLHDTVPKGTTFKVYFIEKAQRPSNGVIFLITEEDDTVQHGRHCSYELKDDMKIKKDFEESVLVVTLKYFFKPHSSRNNKFHPKTIAIHMGKELQSDKFEYITVETLVTQSFTVKKGPNPQPDDCKRIGVYLNTYYAPSNRVPDVEGFLKTYFRNVRHGPYHILPQDPPPS